MGENAHVNHRFATALKNYHRAEKNARNSKLRYWLSAFETKET